jgi:hypothetical protein
MKKYRNMLKGKAGVTLLELLIAALMTVLVTTAAFTFFIRSHQQYISQENIAEAQENACASIEEISRQLRMAGYNIPDTINAFEVDSVSGGLDTLVIRRDTLEIRYYVDRSDTLNPNLMKEVNGVTEIFAEQISSFKVSRVAATSLKVTLKSCSDKKDSQIMGGKKFSRTESQTITIRNTN